METQKSTQEEKRIKLIELANKAPQMEFIEALNKFGSNLPSIYDLSRMIKVLHDTDETLETKSEMVTKDYRHIGCGIETHPKKQDRLPYLKDIGFTRFSGFWTGECIELPSRDHPAEKKYGTYDSRTCKSTSPAIVSRITGIEDGRIRLSRDNWGVIDKEGKFCKADTAFKYITRFKEQNGIMVPLIEKDGWSNSWQLYYEPEKDIGYGVLEHAAMGYFDKTACPYIMEADTFRNNKDGPTLTLGVLTRDSINEILEE